MILGICLGIFAVVAIILVQERKRQRKMFLYKVHTMWGNVPDREYTTEELDSISHYSKKAGKDRFYVDDITWNDLQLDQIFMLMNGTISSCGEDVLYSMLRNPEFDSERLTERNRVIEFFRTHETERIQVQQELQKAKKIANVSVSDYLHRLKDVDRNGGMKYWIMCMAAVLSMLLILWEPLQGFMLTLVVLCANGMIRMQDGKKIEAYLNSFVSILRLLRAAEGFQHVKIQELQEYLDKITTAGKKMKGFQRGAFLVASASGMQDGLEALVMTYIRLVFQVDFIKFYSMLRCLEGNEEEIEVLFSTMGTLDACIAIASFREWLPFYCEPVLEEKQEDQQIHLQAENLYHPLLQDPVANSVTLSRGMLVTGSNASGKSTFLKVVALNAVLAQSIFTCVASYYQGNYVKVMTSMALRDNLQGGESYYIVEIKSLQRILEECKKGESVLCVVDEVLRGTNTIERIAASSRILRSMAKNHILPLAATHDIELSYILENEFENYHFEEEIQGKDVIFNYQLQKGRATSRNAIKLLEMIGYDDAIIEDAQNAAREFEKTGVWK